MTIPGFKKDEEENDTTDLPKIQLNVPWLSEWRFEVPFKIVLYLKVVEGIGEIFGTELPLGLEMRFSGCKYALFSPTKEGCKIEYYKKLNKDVISNEEDDIIEYTTEENTMKNIENLHFVLEAMRQDVCINNIINSTSLKIGPKVLIIGKPFTGKTTLAKILSSYAIKMDSTPVLVNLNPRDGVFSLPGSISATVISDNLDVESAGGWGFSTISGTTSYNPKQPVVKNFGFAEISNNLDLYKYQISKLGVVVMSRINEDIDLRNSGLIIDTPPLTRKDINLIENIVSDFEINVVVVLGSEQLLLELKKKFKHRQNQLIFIKIPKSEGVVDLDDFFIRRLQEQTIKEYFHGNHRMTLAPFKTEIEIDNFIFYKSVPYSDLKSTLSFLPDNDSYSLDAKHDLENKVKENKSLDNYYLLLDTPKPSDLDNTIIAVTLVPQNNNQFKNVLNGSVVGYVYLSKIEESKIKMKVLLPFTSPVPKNILILTSFSYSE